MSNQYEPGYEQGYESGYDANSYPEACKFVVPICLRIPIVLEPEVSAKPPVCHKNGHRPAAYASQATFQSAEV